MNESPLQKLFSRKLLITVATILLTVLGVQHVDGTAAAEYASTPVLTTIAAVAYVVAEACVDRARARAAGSPESAALAATPNLGLSPQVLDELRRLIQEQIASERELRTPPAQKDEGHE